MSDEPTPAAPQRGVRQALGPVLITALVSAAVTFGLVALLLNIFGRKQEARTPFVQVVQVDERTEDPSVWGRNFPFQYDGYLRTVDQTRTRFGGSEAVQRTPTAADPRSIVSQSRLEEDPRLVTMWSGYAFAVDFREERGHAYMLEDQTFTERQRVKPQPGTCLNCHASMVVPYLEAGDGDPLAGFHAINQMTYPEARELASHPVTCLDCHHPETMELRVTRPAFMEGIRLVKLAQGISNYDVNRDATRQEMRTYVCGQCHVEYYFKGEGKTLTYPWHNGLRADQILAYYDEQGFHDWEHKETGAKALKAQHPEFEMWNQGTHAAAGVACADCHMPYSRVGAMKVTDHHIQSPLLNVNRACQTCHKASEEDLLNRAERLQERTYEVRNVAMDALVELIEAIAAAQAQGAEDLDEARDFQRKAQFLLDFVEAENSMGFHAPQEAVRLGALSIDYSRQGMKAVAR